MHQKPHRIFIYTALPCEAKPLIEYFSLKKDTTAKAFTFYFNQEVCLTITGIGKNAMAAGVAYSQALFASAEHPVLLNIGIAGHKQHSLGSLFIINKIIDADSQRSFYPPLIVSPDCDAVSLRTVSKPQIDYDETALCDMEASAFYETAIRFSSGELIQCLKVVSDNELSPIANIAPNQVSELIAVHASTIDSFAEQLKLLAEQITEPDHELFEDLLKRYHFTMSEKMQLKSRLRRWALLTDRQLPELSETQLHKGKDVLRWLDQQINKMDFYL
ncbi:MAG: phosphorylase family protein [Methylovulum sp.]